MAEADLRAQVEKEIATLLERAASSSDKCLVAQAIALRDDDVLEKLFERLDAECYDWRGTVCKCSENLVTVVFRFEQKQDAFCLVPGTFAADVSLRHCQVTGIVDPYDEDADDHCGCKPGGDSQCSSGCAREECCGSHSHCPPAQAQCPDTLYPGCTWEPQLCPCDPPPTKGYAMTTTTTLTSCGCQIPSVNLPCPPTPYPSPYCSAQVCQPATTTTTLTSCGCPVPSVNLPCPPTPYPSPICSTRASEPATTTTTLTSCGCQIPSVNLSCPPTPYPSPICSAQACEPATTTTTLTSCGCQIPSVNLPCPPTPYPSPICSAQVCQPATTTTTLTSCGCPVPSVNLSCPPTPYPSPICSSQACPAPVPEQARGPYSQQQNWFGM